MVAKIQKQKTQKRCVMKRNLKFENYKKFLEVTKLDNKIIYKQKIKLILIVLKKVINNS